MTGAYILRKLLTFAVLPLGIVAWLLVLALVFKKRRFIAAALLALYFFSIPLVSDRMIGILERQYPRLDMGVCPTADAVVVLGGLVSNWRGRGEVVEWSEAVDRFEQGVGLVLGGKAPLLILGGGPLGDGDGRVTEGDAMRQAAISRGVAPESIRVIRGAVVTAGEARGVSELTRKEGLRQVILVTSAFHMPRAVYLFEQAGIEVVPFPVDYQSRAGWPLTALDFVPQAEELSKTERAVKEFYGLLYYRLR